MKVLTAGVGQALVAHLRRRIPVLQVDICGSLDCLQALQEGVYALLVLGAEDAPKSGLEVLQVVRDVFDVDALPIIYLLPRNLDPEKGLKGALRLQPQHVLMVPFSPDDLLDKVSELLDVPIARPPLTAPIRRRTTGSLLVRSWPEQQAMLGTRLDLLERVAEARDAGPLPKNLVRSGVNEVERLRRFLSENGHEVGVQLVTQLAPIFSSEEALDEPVSALVVRLRMIVAEPPGPVPSAAVENAEPDRPYRGRILVVDTDMPWLEALSLEAVARDLAFEVAADCAEAAYKAHCSPPNAVIVDTATADLSDADMLLRELEANDVPMVQLTADNSWATRLSGSRLGARRFLSKARTAADVLGQVEDVLAWNVHRPSRILVLDEDPNTHLTLGGLSESNRYVVESVADVTQLAAMLDSARADALVVAIGGESSEGLDACRVVRTDPNWGGLPILALTTEEDPALVDMAYRIGVDDVLPKAALHDGVEVRLRSRLARQRAIRGSEQVDLLTDLGGRGRAVEQFGHFLASAEHYSVPVCLVLLNLDLFGDINTVLGHEKGDAMLRQFARFLETSLPAETLIARLSGDEFVLGFYGQGRSAVTELVVGLQQALDNESFATLANRPVRLGFSAGVVEYPADGTLFVDLLRSAATLVAETKARGRLEVLSSAWFEDADFMARPVHLLIIHPDEALASQVLTALAVRGYHGYWMGDAGSILSRLLDAAYRNPNLVVVWHLGIAEVDSWAILHVIEQDAAMANARFLLLATNVTETTRMEAERLGARALLDADLVFTQLLYHVRHVLEN